MADFRSALMSGVPQTDMRGVDHQIRITTETGHTAHLMVGCVCGAPKTRSIDGTDDHWALFNALTHDEQRGPFHRVDPISGRLTHADTGDEP
jgi:hypothetical protein